MNHTSIVANGISGMHTVGRMQNRRTAPRTATAENAGKSDVAAKTEETNAAADMTMSEYKTYIYDKISALPVHPTQMNRSASIFISEEGFEAMKENPDYEEWVIDKLQEDFAVSNPLCARYGSYVVYQFGAKKSDYRGDSWYAEFQGGQGKRVYRERSQGSFWDNRAAVQKKILAQHDADVREQKRLAGELAQEQATLSASREKIAAKRGNVASAASSYDAHSVFWDGSAASPSSLVTTKKILPDGSIYITTKKDGKIVERTTKKPHMVPVLDPTAKGGVKMEPMQDIFELLMM